MAAPRSASLGTWRRDAARRMAASRRETLAFVTRLPEREVLRARTIDRWSVKDVLGHLLACDEEMARYFDWLVAVCGAARAALPDQDWTEG